MSSDTNKSKHSLYDSDENLDEEQHATMRHKEGDRIVALNDEFSTGAADVPSVVSTSFGHPLEVIESGLPPLRKQNSSSVPDSTTEGRTSSSSLKATSTFVESEQKVSTRDQDLVAKESRDPSGFVGKSELSVKEVDASHTPQSVPNMTYVGPVVAPAPLTKWEIEKAPNDENRVAPPLTKITPGPPKRSAVLQTKLPLTDLRYIEARRQPKGELEEQQLCL